MPAEERGMTLQEIRTHLEDLAGEFIERGANEPDAQRLAIEAFGDVRRVSRQLSAGHLVSWSGARWLGGIGIGAIATWTLWIAGTFPVLQYNLTINPMLIDGVPTPPTAIHTLTQSMPLTSGAFFAYLSAGWGWLILLMALYAAPPLLWGRRAHRWWAPGLAYGLGTWLSVPWAVVYFFVWNTGDWGFVAEARLVLLALPLALLASAVGHIWRTSIAPERANTTQAAA